VQPVRFSNDSISENFAVVDEFSENLCREKYQSFYLNELVDGDGSAAEETSNVISSSFSGIVIALCIVQCELV
jgi:hypothetical protein